MLAPREWSSIAARYQMCPVRTIEEIRHARLLQLLEDKERYPTIQALADAIERSHAQVSQWKNRSERRNKDGEVVGVSNIESASARWIEQKTGKPTGWMDNDPDYDVRAISVQSARTGDEPEAPDFNAREVTESEWAILEGVRVMPEPEIAALRQKALEAKAHYERLAQQFLTKAIHDDGSRAPADAPKRGRK